MAAWGPGPDKLAERRLLVPWERHIAQAREAARGRLVQEIRVESNGDSNRLVECRVRSAGGQRSTCSQDSPARHLEVNEWEGQSAEAVLVGENVWGAGGASCRTRVPEKDWGRQKTKLANFLVLKKMRANKCTYKHYLVETTTLIGEIDWLTVIHSLLLIVFSNFKILNAFQIESIISVSESYFLIQSTIFLIWIYPFNSAIDGTRWTWIYKKRKTQYITKFKQ